MENNDFNNWELDKLSNHIVSTHHVYVREMIPQILAYSDKVAKVHGESHPEVIEIHQAFETLAPALEEHMAGEEKYLFPYIEKLLNAKRDGVKLPKPGFGTIETPLKHHYEEHDNAWGYMQKINQLSNNYALPNDACGTYTALYNFLKDFEADLKQHIHIENEVLFGKSIGLEKEVIA